MGITNLNNVHLDNAKLTAIQDAIGFLETALMDISTSIFLRKTENATEASMSRTNSW